MVSNSSLPFPRVYRQLQTVRFSWFLKFQTPSTCWSLNYTFRRKTWCFFSFWLEISTSFFYLKIRTGAPKNNDQFPSPHDGESPISEVSEGYHIDGFRCDAISSMYLFGVVFFFCLDKETGQSFRVWRGGGVFFFLFDSAFISWIQPLKVFFLGGGVEVKRTVLISQRNRNLCSKSTASGMPHRSLGVRGMWSFRAKKELVHLVPWRWRGKIFVTKEPQAGGVSSTWVILVLWNIFSCFFVPFLKSWSLKRGHFQDTKTPLQDRVFSTLPLEGLWGFFLQKKICERVGKPNNRSTTSWGSCDFWCFSGLLMGAAKGRDLYFFYIIYSYVYYYVSVLMAWCHRHPGG